jgi:hypothetical protein
MEQFQSDVEQAASSVPDAAWSESVYEGGWNSRQILSDIASTSGVAGFILNLAQGAGPASPGGGDFDVDAFNKMQVEMRAGKSTDDVLAEIRDTLKRDAASVQAADDALLNRHFKTPWELEGTVGDLIVGSFHEHLGMHLADLRSAAS